MIKHSCRFGIPLYTPQCRSAVVAFPLRTAVLGPCILMVIHSRLPLARMKRQPLNIVVSWPKCSLLLFMASLCCSAVDSAAIRICKFRATMCNTSVQLSFLHRVPPGALAANTSHRAARKMPWQWQNEDRDESSEVRENLSRRASTCSTATSWSRWIGSPAARAEHGPQHQSDDSWSA